MVEKLKVTETGSQVRTVQEIEKRIKELGKLELDQYGYARYYRPTECRAMARRLGAAKNALRWALGEDIDDWEMGIR